jgi:hypothetical protein
MNLWYHAFFRWGQSRPGVIGVQNFLERLAMLGSTDGAHLAKTNTMAESSAANVEGLDGTSVLFEVQYKKRGREISQKLANLKLPLDGFRCS